MANKNTIWLVLIGIVILLAFGGMIQKNYNLFAISGSSMTRSAPTFVQPSSTFQITYTVSGVTGKYGVSVIDTVSGGCTPIGEHKFVMADDAQYTTTQSFSYTAPASGSCTFTGDYKFGTDAIKAFPSLVVTVNSDTNQTICPTDAKQCPDGSYVSRVPPSCEFAICPSGTASGFDINMVLFKIGTFNVTLLMLAGGIVTLLIVMRLIGR